MAIKRYFSISDTTLTNAYQSDLKTRGTGSNMGAADILETFTIYAQANRSSSEFSRILVQFPINQIISDRNISKIPSSGSVNFFFKLYNAPHSDTLPTQFTLNVLPVSRSWEEGFGLDMDNYLDVTRNQTGANWIYAASGTQWTNQGGDYVTSSFTGSQFFSQGFEDLEIDITSLVESWVSGALPNYGMGIFLTSSQESGTVSYFTKKFFARSSEFFFKRPLIEARWDSSTKDERQKFFVSSSLLSANDNAHTIYLYNYVRGQLKDIPSIGTGSIYLQV